MNQISNSNLIVGSGGRWTQGVADKFMDRAYSEDVGTGAVGNGDEADHIAHNWIGRGIIQMTHKKPFEQLAAYIATHYPELVIAEGVKTKQQTLMDNTKLITDITNQDATIAANAYMLSALSGAWFWSIYAANSSNPQGINQKADVLNFVNPIALSEQTKFNAVSTMIVSAHHPERWKLYKDDIAPPILTGGNPYESMTEALKRVGIIATGATGYETQFGISLAKRVPLKINDSIQSLMAEMPATELPYLDKMLLVVAQTQVALNLKEGEFTMWMTDVPTQQINPPAIYMAANTVSDKIVGAVSVQKLGVCQVINGDVSVSPMSDAGMYIYEFKPLLSGDFRGSLI